MTLVAAIVPVAVLIWLATRRPSLRTAGGQRGSPAASLFAHAAWRLDGVHITHIVELEDDLIVGYAGGNAEGQLLLPGVVRDARSMELLQRWQAQQTSLSTARSADGALVGIADWPSRWAVVVTAPGSS